MFSYVLDHFENMNLKTHAHSYGHIRTAENNNCGNRGTGKQKLGFNTTGKNKTVKKLIINNILQKRARGNQKNILKSWRHIQ